MAGKSSSRKWLQAAANSAFSLFFGTAAMAAPVPSGSADLIIRNGHVFASKGNPTAIAVKGERIVAVGSDAEMEKLRVPATQVIDAAGRAILPGFNDNHMHLAWGAASLAHPDVRTAKNLSEIQAIVRDHAAAHPQSPWVEAGGWLPQQIPGEAPTREMLDAAVPDRPAVLFSLDRHSAWLNTRALAVAHITDTTPDPVQGIIVRDAQGHATGWLKEFTAIDLVYAAMPPLSQADRRELMAAAMDEAHRFGVTSVTQAGGSPEEFEILDAMRRDRQLSLRINYALLVKPGFTDAQFDRYQVFWKAHPDTELLKTGTVKLFMDGVPQAQTAFLLHPYGPQQEDGRPVFAPEEYYRLARRFDAAGWQLMVHAIGDGAVRLALNGIEEAEKANPVPLRGRRHRIEHVVLMDPADTGRFGKLGVIAAYQPVDVFRRAAEPASPPNADRPPADGARWNAVSAQGGRISFGSDWPVFSMNALARIYAIANSARTDQRMPAPKLIEDYTQGSAYATFDEANRGSLEPGKFADIAIIGTNLLDRKPTSADDIKVDATLFNGRLVYVRSGICLRRVEDALRCANP